MKTTIFRNASLMTAILLAVACSSDDATGPGPSSGNGSPVGSYVMTQVDGNNLPYLYDQGAVSGGTIKRYWLSGDVTFKADSTFSIKLVGKTTGPGQSGNPSTTSWTGTWRLEPGGVELTNSGGKSHWTSSDNLASLIGPGTYTKVSGGKDTLNMQYRKQ